MNAVSRLHPTSRLSPQRFSLSTNDRVAAYRQHWPLLALAGVFGLMTVYILTSVPPAAINWKWLPDVYLPFQIATYGCLFFLSSFCLLHTRRGYLLATALQALIFLKLQHVNLTVQLLLSLIGMFVIIEVLIISGSMLGRHANFSQKSHRHHRSRHP